MINAKNEVSIKFLLYFVCPLELKNIMDSITKHWVIHGNLWDSCAFVFELFYNFSESTFFVTWQGMDLTLTSVFLVISVTVVILFYVFPKISQYVHRDMFVLQYHGLTFIKLLISLSLKWSIYHQKRILHHFLPWSLFSSECHFKILRYLFTKNFFVFQFIMLR